MLLPIKVFYLKKLDPSEKDKNRFKEWIRWNSDEEIIRVPSEIFTKEDIKKLEKWAEKDSDEKVRGGAQFAYRLKLLKNLSKDIHGVKIQKLEQLEDAFKKIIGKTPNKWLFKDDGDIALPYFVSKVKFHEGVFGREGRPAYVQLDLNYIFKGSLKSSRLSFTAVDLKGRTAIEILNDEGYYLETELAFEEYEKEIEDYKKYSILLGKQFNAVGFAKLKEERWYSETISMVRDGVVTKVIMDDFEEDDNNNRRERGGHNTILNVWGNIDHEKNDENKDEKIVVPPTHPYVQVFDLIRHQYIIIHINNLSPYIYDEKLSEKLVLPKDRKNLIDILIQGTTITIEDIVKGKTDGIIILATGEPGTGKTLTAEVYSEAVKKPLYVVQCSQLGTNEEELEKELTLVLSRASRWKAILLIDEADVYIYKRGSDIRQNAIVGVFLRVLEYYKGILFLTSNRETIIDDAILSRLTAHIRYTIPTQEEQGKIWRILANQFKIKLEDEIIEKVTKEFSGISGRTVKNILKLSILLSRRKNIEVDFDVIKYASTFIDYSNNKN